MSNALSVLRNFVAGTYTDPVDRRTAPVVDPSTGEAYASAPVSSAEDVDAAMTAAAEGFEVWRDTTPAERQRALLLLEDKYVQYRERHLTQGDGLVIKIVPERIQRWGWHGQQQEGV